MVVAVVAEVQGDFWLKIYKNLKKVNISRTTAVFVLFLAPMDRELNSKLFSKLNYSRALLVLEILPFKVLD